MQIVYCWDTEWLTLVTILPCGNRKELHTFTPAQSDLILVFTIGQFSRAPYSQRTRAAKVQCYYAF